MPEGQYLLDKVRISVDSTSGDFNNQELLSYLRQQPNHKMLWSAKFRLGIYNMSGKDTTRWWNRWVRKLGEPPVVYDSLLTDAGVVQLRKALVNKGYLHARVSADTIIDHKKRKVEVDYRLLPGEPYTIGGIDVEYDSPEIAALLGADSTRRAIRPGDPLDRSLLEAERERITSRLRNHGFYTFDKEMVAFNADTTAGSRSVDLTMRVAAPSKKHPLLPGNDTTGVAPERFIIRKVVYVTDYDPSLLMELGHLPTEKIRTYKGIEILYGKKQYLRAKVLWENCFLLPGSIYREADVERTYNALARLEILKFINIHFRPVGQVDDSGLLDVYILLTPGKSQSFSVELEGTNSEGDLGVAVGASYSHRNAGRGSETLTVKLRGAYESISGNLQGLINNHYQDYSLDFGISYPKFKAPFLRENFKRRINASTDLNFSVNYQERPEYTRIISTAGWSYKWTERETRNRHTFTPIDINYVYLPKSTYGFINEIAPDNPLLRYSYEDHFIMRLGYSFYHTNKRPTRAWSRFSQPDIWTLRVNAEIAGNFLFLLSNIFQPGRNFRADPYRVFGIHYSQYFKVEGDYGYLHIFDERNSVALHAGLGVGYPYGNSAILPFEKRFYGGGANGVRGWAVRTLGPGSFPGTNSVSDFINQCGDIRVDLSAEYRAKLFWVIELGAFIDIGNIWTIKDYPNQPGGLFSFSRFYKELAAAYGLGLRMDFSYFLLRFDLGMKAHNPARGEEPWPLIHPQWHRDHSFHFSIGYPF